MKICFVLNQIEIETAGTSVAIMKKAHQRGHEVYVMDVGGFQFVSGGEIKLFCKKLTDKISHKTAEEFLADIQADSLKFKLINSDELDVLFIRNNPTEEPTNRHWAEQAAIAFGRMIQQRGQVLVLNDAFAMSHAYIDKLYFEELPEVIKPASKITRSKKELMEFYEKHDKKMVLKPLEGSGGQNVYLIDENSNNLNQIIDVIRSEGYVIAQEFLPKVSKGDVRLILMNGKLLEEGDHTAIITRKSGKGEFRNNFSVGGTAKSAKLTKHMQKIVDLTAPKLIRDGLFFVGLDIVDDKLIEINVLSPGGITYFSDLGMPDFTDTIVEAIERKIDYKSYYKGYISNRELATMN